MSLFVSYAQNGEDVMLWRALGEISNGFYIDVGAGDPIINSVTYAFYSKGWRGINIEPHPTPFARLAACRERDININAAISSEDGTSPFFIFDEYERSTSVETVAKRYETSPTQVATVPTTRLAAVCEQLSNTDVHFLKIDVEGAEESVLLSANLQAIRPWIIVVESIDPVTTEHAHGRWERVLTDARYLFAHFDGLNRFYIAEERDNTLRHFFDYPVCTRDAYIRSDETQLSLLRQLERYHEHHLELLQSQVSAIITERDAFEQEMYEINRYSAYLARERQRLLDEAALNQAEAALNQANVARHLDDANKRINAILTSSSWKLAAPLRRLASIVRPVAQ
jgi:FkbM family methyltransferase